MTTLNLTDQQIETTAIQPKINKLNQLLLLRKPIWDKLTYEQRKFWILSDKDPIMALAWTIYKYLNNNFFGEKYYNKEDVQ